MFGVLDSAKWSDHGNDNRKKTSADRACDQCKQRKVRCNMTKRCLPCTSKSLKCTYEKARKKRGPAGKRLPAISPIHQRSMSSSEQLGESPLHHPSPGESQHINTTPLKIGTTVEKFPQESLDWSPDMSSQVEGSILSPSSFVDLPFPQQQSGPGEAVMSGISPQALENEALITGVDNYLFPSLPVDSPSGLWDPFAAIAEQDLPPLAETIDVWPAKVNETTLLPWIDVYFKRLHPTIPILNRANIYSEMLLRKHRIDPHYGAMLLGLCAFAMTQPVQIHERESMPSRSVQARMLLDECVKMRVDASFGENPTIEMVLASFFLFACLFGSNQHKAARHRLREAVDLAYTLGIHLPDSYTALPSELQEQWLRTYLVLSVTERAYALQQNHPINFRGRPGITARFMQAFDSTVTNEYISSLLYLDQSDAVGMTGLLYLMDTFDAIDESVMDCWNGHCSFGDGVCESFDRRRALQMFRAQHRVREACISGNVSFAPRVAPFPLARLLESQQVDISITQFWLLNRLWQLCLSHQLLRESSDHTELRYDFVCHVAHILLVYCKRVPLSAMEVHGVGLVEKVYDVAMGIMTAMSASAQVHLDIMVPTYALDIISDEMFRSAPQMNIRMLLEELNRLIRDFRGGDHQYVAKFAGALRNLPGFYT